MHGVDSRLPIVAGINVNHPLGRCWVVVSPISSLALIIHIQSLIMNRYLLIIASSCMPFYLAYATNYSDSLEPDGDGLNDFSKLTNSLFISDR